MHLCTAKMISLLQTFRLTSGFYFNSLMSSILKMKSCNINYPFIRVFISKGALVEERAIKKLHKTSVKLECLDSLSITNLTNCFKRLSAQQVMNKPWEVVSPSCRPLHIVPTVKIPWPGFDDICAAELVEVSFLRPYARSGKLVWLLCRAGR